MISSVLEKGVGYREVRTLKDIRYMEASHSILKCNLFEDNWGRSVPFIPSYSLLIYSRVTYKISTRKNLDPKNA